MSGYDPLGLLIASCIALWMLMIPGLQTAFFIYHVVTGRCTDCGDKHDPRSECRDMGCPL
jgi:hypothetical protein